MCRSGKINLVLLEEEVVAIISICVHVVAPIFADNIHLREREKQVSTF